MGIPASPRFDTLFRNALVFDGSTSTPQLLDVAISGDRIAAIGRQLPAGQVKVVDCSGRWLMPGLLDIHTHLDLEVELAPELPEVVRHGTTTVVMSNCSLGIAYGNQRRNGADPIVDCFARVENVPKHVLRKVGDAVDWTDSGAYLDHFDRLALGPNVTPLIPHSMLRIEVMGLQDSVSREPTADELLQMEALVEKGMQEGYVGFSTDALPFHYLANQPNTRRQIPTQFASFSELRRLTGIVRRWGRVWQATPPKDSPIGTLRTFLLSSGRLFGRPLKTTATAAIDMHCNRAIARMGILLSRLLNSRVLRGQFRFQALSAPFKVWSDGMITPNAEEVPELRVLNELELDDAAGRRRILDDPAYVKDFRRMWFKGRRGFNMARIKRWLRIEDNVLNRRLDDMFIDRCPLAHWSDEALEAPFQRLRRWQQTSGREGAKDAEEAAFFSTFPNPVGDDANFFLHLLRQWDTRLRWYTTTANRDPDRLRKLLFDRQTFPGFNDSGAHLTNMAFYDGNLRTLKIAQQEGIGRVAEAVHRLTQAPAEFFGLAVGSLRVGAQADLCLVDPEALRCWEPEKTIHYVWRDLFDSHQMVNRPEGVVAAVMIRGRLVWQGGAYTPVFGTERCGRLLRASNHPSERDWKQPLAA